MDRTRRTVLVVLLIGAVGVALLVILARALEEIAEDRAAPAERASPQAAPAVGDPPALASTPGTPPPPDPVEPPKVVRVVGRTVDEAGAAVADAEVAVASLDDGKRASLGPEWPPVTRSGADGTFSVDVESTAPSVRVLARAPGRAPGRADAVPGVSVDVVLRAGASLLGTISGPDGKPVPGASVAYQYGAADVLVEIVARTDERGEYRLDGLLVSTPAAGTAFVEARADGLAPRREPAPPLEVGVPRRFDLELGRGAILRGRVIDVETSEPIEGVRITLIDAWFQGGDADPQGPFRRRPTAEGRTRPDGRYEVLGIPAIGASRPSPQGARAEREGYAMGFFGGHYRPTEGAEIEWNPALWPAATLEGVVRDERGEPVPGIMVAVSQQPTPGQWIVAQKRSGTDGTFRLDGVLATRKEDTEVEVHAHWLDRSGIAKARVRGGTVTRGVEIRIAGNPSVSLLEVLVTRPDGSPAVGARVVREDQSGFANRFGPDHDEPRGIAATTDAAGRARLRSFASRSGRGARSPGVVSAALPGFPRAAAWEHRPGSDGIVRIALEAPRAVEGRVVWDRGGAPVAGAQVAAWDAGWSDDQVLQMVERPGGTRDDPGPTVPARRAIAFATSDAEGRFRLEPVPAGPAVISATRGRPAVRRAVGPEAVEIRLPGDPPPPGRTVEVVVKDVSGADRIRIAAKASIAPADGPPWSGELVGFGRFRFDDTKPGTYALRVRAPGFQPSTSKLEVRPGAEPLVHEVRLSTGATLTGRVTVEDGKPEHLSLSLIRDELSDHGPDRDEDLPEDYEWGRASADGSFEFRGLAPGRYRTVESRSGRGHAVASPAVVDVPEQGDVRADFRYVAGFRLTVRAEVPSGRLEVVDRSGVVRRREAATGYPAGLRSSGVRLAPGTYVVRLVLDDGRPPIEQEVVLDQDRAVQLNVK